MEKTVLDGQNKLSTRCPVPFPVIVDGIWVGISADLNGQDFSVQLPDVLSIFPPDSKHRVKVRFSNTEAEEFPAKVVSSESHPESGIIVGMQLAGSGRFDSNRAEAAAKNLSRIDESFRQKVLQMRKAVAWIKAECDLRDSRGPRQSPGAFLEELQGRVFPAFDKSLAQIWDLYTRLHQEGRRAHQLFCQWMLHDLVEEQVEINRHIYRKPLGYPGDFMMMNYIYDYHAGRYLGKTTFEKLINRYTCNIPISKSNIGRKEYLKKQIEKVIRSHLDPSLLSVGSGPLRELVELLTEGKIAKPFSFACVDFEKKAIAHAEKELAKLPSGKRGLIRERFVIGDVVSIIRKKDFRAALGQHDLIYVSGVFDYLSDRLASALAEQLFRLLKGGGRLIIVNASLQRSSHRAYYEILGEWDMYHRTEEEMLNWVRPESRPSIRFESVPNCPGYLFMVLDKLA